MSFAAEKKNALIDEIFLSCPRHSRKRMVLIYIPIEAEAFERRELLRRTILSTSFSNHLFIHHVFVIGFSDDQESQKKLEIENVTYTVRSF